MQPTETEGLDKFFSCALKWRTDPEGSQGDSVCKVSGEGLYWRKYLNRSKTRTPIVSFMAGGIENTGKLKGSTYWGNKSIYFHSTVCNRFMELTDSFFAKGLKDKTIGKNIYKWSCPFARVDSVRNTLHWLLAIYQWAIYVLNWSFTAADDVLTMWRESIPVLRY